MSTVLDWILTVMRTIGAPGVGVSTALETLSTAGSLAGAHVLYLLGAASRREAGAR
jgi:hypothetical protein